MVVVALVARCWTQIEGGLPCLDAIKLGQAAKGIPLGSNWDATGGDGPREPGNHIGNHRDFDGPTGDPAESLGDGCPMLPQLVPEFLPRNFLPFRDRTAIASAPVNMFAWAPSEGGCLDSGKLRCASGSV